VSGAWWPLLVGAGHSSARPGWPAWFLLFAFEFIEGNTITRLYFMRMRRLTRIALAQGRLTEELAAARDRLPGRSASIGLDAIRRRNDDCRGCGNGPEHHHPETLSLGRQNSWGSLTRRQHLGACKSPSLPKVALCHEDARCESVVLYER
jgi:hypothetical protein